MSFANSVTIGPAFFKKAFNDYSNRYWAFVREILQNSMDCGSTHISISITEHDGETTVIVRNNGAPMTREILVEKLLALGESGKDFQGTVGGFGKAKEILYLAQKRYTIWSGEWDVRGSGAGYDIEPLGAYWHGTSSTVVWDGEVAHRLRAAFREFIALARWKGTFSLDGEAMPAGNQGGRYRRDLERDGKPFARVFTTKALEHKVIVRIGGIPMFTQECDYKGGVIVELLGTSADSLTANRDGLRYPYSNRLNEFVTSLAVDRRSALRREEPTYQRIEGAKLAAVLVSRVRPLGPPLSPEVVATVARAAKVLVEAAQDDAIDPGLPVVPPAPVGVLGHGFVVKNCYTRSMPKRYDPNSLAWCDNAAWLVRGWAGSLVELHALHENEASFVPGFVFSEDVEAQFEHGDYGRAFYLNPVKFGKRGFVARYGRKDRTTIVALAAHEYVHGGLGVSYHGEDFAGKLTDLMGLVLRNWRRFARHFV